MKALPLEAESVDVFVVVPENRRGEAPRIEKNLDGMHWTAKEGATGALAVFEHKHPDAEGALVVRQARITYPK
ncbi:MAG: hypothetical protein WKG52_07950 [Variovorax sp.]